MTKWKTEKLKTRSEIKWKKNGLGQEKKVKMYG
jgi:hypothetical protein